MRDHRPEQSPELTRHRFEDHQTFVRRPKPSTARAKAKVSKLARRKNRTPK